MMPLHTCASIHHTALSCSGMPLCPVRCIEDRSIANAGCQQQASPTVFGGSRQPAFGQSAALQQSSFSFGQGTPSTSSRATGAFGASSSSAAGTAFGSQQQQQQSQQSSAIGSTGAAHYPYRGTSGDDVLLLLRWDRTGSLHRCLRMSCRFSGRPRCTNEEHYVSGARSHRRKVAWYRYH